MFKKLLLALAITTAFATPALAATPYVEATTNYNLTNDADYGLKAGVQLNNLTLEAGAENFLDHTPTYMAGVGIQPKLFGPFSAYGTVSYLNTSGNDGFRLGGGLKVNLTQHLYAKGGYQRDDYGQGHSDRATAALGVQF